MTETRAQSGPRTEMTQIQVSLPNGAVKCVLGPPGAGEQAGGSSAAFAGAPAATRSRLLDFLLGPRFVMDLQDLYLIPRSAYDGRAQMA